MLRISESAYKAFLKENNIVPGGSMTSEQYRQLVAISDGKTQKQTRCVTQKTEEPFAFQYSIEVLPGKMCVTLYGKHLSKNRFNALSFRGKLAYKGAIKKAANAFFAKNPLFHATIKPYSRFSIHYVFHNPKSRDYDNNSETIKTFQDTFTFYGLIKDDARACMVSCTYSEVIDKTYKVVATICEQK